MSADNQTTRLLSELGLSEYETRAYLNVIEGGVMVAREISDRASIPYAKVYQTLNDLIEKQLITGDEGRPKKFRARPPREAIEDRLQSMQRQWEEAHEKRRDLLHSILPELESLYDASDVHVEEEQGVWNISGSTNISSRLARLAAMTTEQLLIVTGNWSSVEENFLKTLIDNSTVPITVIATTEVDHEAIGKMIVRKDLGAATNILFDTIAMVSIAEIQKGKYSSGEYTAVLTQIRALVESAIMNYEVFLDE